jgi:hypothetical protein
MTNPMIASHGRQVQGSQSSSTRIVEWAKSKRQLDVMP